MNGRIAGLWRGRTGAAPAPDSAVVESSHPAAERPTQAVDPLASVDLPAPAAPSEVPAPEQPVLLVPSGAPRPVHVGEVLPATRRGWPGPLARIPSVPKRVILAAGVCAGMAAPGIARHLATRLLFGPPAGRGPGVLEITRIVYDGPLTPRAAAAIGKALTAGRR